jgi:FixJ family two-component response regulator
MCADTTVIHVIDDDDSFVASVDSLLRSVDYKTHTHSSVKAFLSAKRPDAPGCIVLDVRLPEIGGLEFLSQLDELNVRLPVILMTGHGDIPMTVRGMKAGAIDFLTKPFRDQDLLDAVAVAIGRDRARRAVDMEKKDLDDRYSSLSPREQEIMRLVTAGKMNKQVAGLINLS